MDIKEIKEAYDKAAINYEKLAFRDKYVAFNKLAKLGLSYYKKNNAKVLDLGCGTGLSSIEFFKKGFDVTGVDISQSMLNQAKKLPFKKLICQDIEKQLKFQDNYFDIIILAGVMEFVKNPLELFKEINNKLKSSGLFLLTIPKKYPKNSLLKLKLKRKSYSKKEIEEIFLKSNFKIIKRKEIFGYFKKINNKTEKSIFYCYILKK